MTYRKIANGEEVVIKGKTIGLCCCDCGLVHDIEIKVKKGKVVMIFTRNNHKTAGMRRYHYKTNEKDSK
jgi:hypothetical protein